MKSLLTCILAANAAFASTIIQSSGNSESTEPLGYYAPYAPYGITPTVFAVGWTQNSTYTGVTVTANIFTPGSSGTLDYALVPALGPGTSFAADGIIRGSVGTPTNPTDLQLFQLPSLAAGTYYLVLDSPTPDTGWDYNFPPAGNYTTASGVTFLGDQWASAASIDTAYTAGSTFSGVSIPVEFNVQGTAATPEPATYSLIGIALLALSAAGRRRHGRG